MKARVLFLLTMAALTFFSCKKETANQKVIRIPNGDFEQWDDMPRPAIWQTNSCPVCLPPFETYIVKKVIDAANGQFAAKFIFNGVYNSYANNKFAISLHPTSLTGYIKSNITSGDTASIYISLFSGNSLVDTGNFYETSSNADYRQINIPISQSATNVDSALIKIIGGKKANTELTVDNLVFIKNY